jgi:hypothetical protein
MVFSFIADALRARQDWDRKGKLALPIAVVVTKSDLLRGSLGFPACADVEDAESILGTFFPDLLTLLCEHVRNYRCFVVSATGSGEMSGQRYCTVRPYNVERPMLWLLKLLAGVEETAHA